MGCWGRNCASSKGTKQEPKNIISFSFLLKENKGKWYANHNNIGLVSRLKSSWQFSSDTNIKEISKTKIHTKRY